MRSKHPLLFALLALLGLLTALASATAGGVKVGDPFPALDRFGLTGGAPSLKGRVTLVDVWATWCPPCRQSFPAFERLLQRFGKERFAVVAVSVDEKPEELKRFLAAHPVSFATPHDTRRALAAALEPAGMPTSYLVDRAGTVRGVFTGFHGAASEKELAAAIGRLLEGGK